MGLWAAEWKSVCLKRPGVESLGSVLKTQDTKLLWILLPENKTFTKDAQLHLADTFLQSD